MQLTSFGAGARLGLTKKAQILNSPRPPADVPIWGRNTQPQNDAQTERVVTRILNNITIRMRAIRLRTSSFSPGREAASQASTHRGAN